MTVLVTGASGFVGSAVARHLVARGDRVRVLVRKNADLSNISGLNIDYAFGDLRDRNSLENAMRGVRSLYHIAADYRLWSKDDADLYRTNVDGTDNILHAACHAAVERIVYTSSVCTLGTHTDGSCADENTPVAQSHMIGAYKKSKYLAEVNARTWIDRGAPIVIVNPSTPIGAGDIKPTPTGRMIMEAVQGKMPAYVNTGLNFVHVDDVAQGHLFAHDRGRIGERYILGGHNLSLKELLSMIAKMMNRQPPTIEIPRQAIYPIALIAETVAKISGNEPFVTINGLRLSKKLMYFSSAKAQAELGYEFRPVRDAVRDAVAWCNINRPTPHAAIVLNTATKGVDGARLQ